MEGGILNEEEVEGLIKSINDKFLEKRYRFLEQKIKKMLNEGTIQREDEAYQEYKQLLSYFKGGKIGG